LAQNGLTVFLFPLLSWLRWVSFGMGVVTVLFWTWTQVTLDTQWTAQLQLTQDLHLITIGPYIRIRHPLYVGMFGFCVALS
jgi:protein-S-isoprenylcysteine O-methyltransferase Ste14